MVRGKKTGELTELLQLISDPVLLTTPEGVITEVNQAALKAAGKSREEIIGTGICQIIHGGRWPHIKCPLEEFLLTRQAKSEDTRLPGLGGEYHLIITPLVAEGGDIDSVMLQARRLSREESLKVESIRTAQLAAIGELAAGVAHEVNNPINGIINFAQLLLDDAEAESLQAELSSRIVNEGERIANIIDSLLSFARENENELSQVDVREVVSECLSLVDHQLRKEGIRVEQNFSREDCHVIGNFMQLQQVVFNAINNSRYALNERYPNSSPDKKIIISCEKVKEEGGNRIRTVIRDLGTGIPQGILDKLFEPFFTSKPKGQGTGLGMSISFGIIQNHGGTLSVDSVLNKYTDIAFDIPATEGSRREADA
ncbi:MAG: two-component system sensor histidine kinase NtrB [Desulfocapsaceae bacterium]